MADLSLSLLYVHTRVLIDEVRPIVISVLFFSPGRPEIYTLLRIYIEIHVYVRIERGKLLRGGRGERVIGASAIMAKSHK